MPHGRGDQIKDGGSFAQTNEIFHQEAFDRATSTSLTFTSTASR
jgi:hypothetical protein